MAYLVSLTARAQRDLFALYQYIQAEDSFAADRWYRGLKRAILSLERFPHRCAVAPEDRQTRHLLYGRKPHIYRVIYRVLERKKIVEVLHVRHGARRDFKP